MTKSRDPVCAVVELLRASRTRAARFPATRSEAVTPEVIVCVLSDSVALANVVSVPSAVAPFRS